MVVSGYDFEKCFHHEMYCKVWCWVEDRHQYSGIYDCSCVTLIILLNFTSEIRITSGFVKK